MINLTKTISFKGKTIYIGPWNNPKGIKLTHDTGVFKYLYKGEVIYIGGPGPTTISSQIYHHLQNERFVSYMDDVNILWIPISVNIEENENWFINHICDSIANNLCYKYLPKLNDEHCSAPENYMDCEKQLTDWLPYSNRFFNSATVYRKGRLPAGSSFCDAAVYYYVHKYFPKAIYRGSSIIGDEIDVYVPYRKVAIEYDGAYYHKKKSIQFKEFDKNEACIRKGITLVRIVQGNREPAWYEIDENGNYYQDDRIIKIYRNSDKASGLNKCIASLLTDVLKVSDSIDVDTERDRDDIERLAWYTISFEFKCKEYLKYWDNEKNGELLPSDIYYKSHEYIWIKCNAGKCFYIKPTSLLKYGLSNVCNHKCDICELKHGPLVDYKVIKKRESSS